MANSKTTIQKLIACAFTTSLAFTIPTIATAATINVDVKAGRTTLIYRYSQYDGDTCGSMAMPKFKIKSVGHGKITGIKGGFVLDKGVCKGKRINGVAFKYTPNRGFRGADTAKVLLTMPAFTDSSGTQSINLNFRINVK